MAEPKNAGNKQLEKMARQWFLDKSIKKRLQNISDADDQAIAAREIEREIDILWQDRPTRHQITQMHAMVKPQEQKTSLEELRTKYGVVARR
jgi:hypothetical protein